MLHGMPVTPIEWFDSKWIHDRLKLKLGGRDGLDVERVRAGATGFLADRGIYRSNQTLPVWHMDESERRIATAELPWT